jgi:N utilization substance protein A
MENLALIDSFSEFKDDKLIDRVTLMACLLYTSDAADEMD